MDKEEELRSYLEQAANEPLLSQEEEVEVATELREANEEVRDRLIRANMRLVVSVARRYEGKGLPLSALVREGHRGLTRAVDGFDPSKGYKLSIHATWFIRQAITRAISGQADA
jgi:RNA polymerase primary sigma factor